MPFRLSVQVCGLQMFLSHPKNRKMGPTQKSTVDCNDCVLLLSFGINSTSTTSGFLAVLLLVERKIVSKPSKEFENHWF